MGKITLEELRKLREEKRKELNYRDPSNKDVKIIIGMATCGIAAGGKETLQAFLDYIDKHHLTNILVKQTGCMGLCAVEPTVEVVMPGMPDVVYGKVTKDVVASIMEKHVKNKELVSDHIYDKPAPDNVVEKK